MSCYFYVTGYYYNFLNKMDLRYESSFQRAILPIRPRQCELNKDMSNEHDKIDCEKFSDGGTLPGRACRATDSQNYCFHL